MWPGFGVKRCCAAFFVMQIGFGLSTDAALGAIVKSGKISLLDRADFI
jgi:hypothetical protein